MRNGAYGLGLGPTRFQVIEVSWQTRLKDAARRRWGLRSSDLPRIFAPVSDSAPSSYIGGPNVYETFHSGLVLAACTVPALHISQAKAYSYHSRYYPKGFYYQNGAWHPSRLRRSVSRGLLRPIGALASLASRPVLCHRRS